MQNGSMHCAGSRLQQPCVERALMHEPVERALMSQHGLVADATFNPRTKQCAADRHRERTACSCGRRVPAAVCECVVPRRGPSSEAGASSTTLLVRASAGAGAGSGCRQY